MEAREHTQANLQLLREQLDSGGMRSARLMIHALHPAEVARLLESLPLRERAVRRSRGILRLQRVARARSRVS